MKIKKILMCTIWFAIVSVSSQQVIARDLVDIQKDGVLRHIGVPYANFISYIHTGEFESVTGLDVEIMQGFAQSLGLKYQYVPANWNNMIGKLTGEDTQFTHNKIVTGKKVKVEGDIVANGVTILDWRKQLIDFSNDYFPSAVWLVSRSDSDLRPIRPSGSLDEDIRVVKELMGGRNVLALEHSCLDPNLYDLYATDANIILPKQERNLNEMVPAILNNDAESTILDVADTLIALEKWPGQIKVIGPISEDQKMAAGFRKDSPELRKAFNDYLSKIKKDGSYQQLVEKYYPSVFDFYNGYFTGNE
ncbi:ABC transporter substrate-binding protein [Vibrio rumoiensis 1S-45]|uniref:ABC transporter substrate-binding protein n=2 Tax=Vibrio rumoiensis TaxID=76258 RepID=A0A1E5E473_9VIBR|nr:ABC transporter substrate-binding protein [Vibrio rumoiensis 1S-45]